MSQTNPTPNQRVVTELKVSAHLMLLDPGLFCIFHNPGGPIPDPVTGFPGVRVSRPPSTPPEALSISTFNADGWLGGEGNAALVRVTDVPSQVLVTIYQAVNSVVEAPKLQVLRLSEAPPARPVQAGTAAIAGAAAPAAAKAQLTPPEGRAEVAAHVQRRGDVLTRLGDWMGVRGSQNWIEGFAIAPTRFVDAADIEYQAVLGKGWLSPWAEGGTYCGSRGMALPILGLRVRLKGDAAERHEIRISATFTDGTAIGPIDGTETAEAPSLAPLEAFLIEIVPLAGIDAEADPAVEDDGAVSEPIVARGRVSGATPAKAAPPVAAKGVKPVKKSLPAPVGRPAVTAPRAASRGMPIAKGGKKGRR